MSLLFGLEIRRVGCPDCHTRGVALDWGGWWYEKWRWQRRLLRWRHPWRTHRWEKGAKGLRAFEVSGFTVPGFIKHLFDLTPIDLSHDMVRVRLFSREEADDD